MYRCGRRRERALLRGKEQAQVCTKRVQMALPDAGNVQIIYITNKQYENIVSFDGPMHWPANKSPEQFALF